MVSLRLVLVIAIFCVPIAEAGHSDEIDCDKLDCLVCHANANEDQSSFSQPRNVATKPARLIISHLGLLIGNAFSVNLPIRGPPRQERGEYV